MAVTVPLLLAVCSLSLTLVQCVDVNQYDEFSSREFSPEYLPEQIEDEVEYLALSKDENIVDYDWSPPSGEQPESYFDALGSLSSYFGNGDDNQRLGERRTGDMVEKVPNNNLKRAFNYPIQKKNQVLCRVERAIHYHKEPGYEFFPKSFTSYSCHPVGPSQFEGTLSTSHDTCFVTGNNCITIEKEQLFLKRRQSTNCWTHFIEAVGAGCKCLPRRYIV